MATIGNLIVLLTADSAKFEQNMQSARKRTKEMQQAIQELQRSGMDRLAAGMTFATTQQQRWQQLSAQGAINLQNLKRSAEGTTRAIGGGVEGFRKFENAIVDVGLGLVGLQGKAGKAAEGLLLMGAGGAVTLALTAGITIIVGLYRLLTAEARKVKEEQDKIIKPLEDRFAGLREKFKPEEVAKERIVAITTQTAEANRKLQEEMARPFTINAKTGLQSGGPSATAIKELRDELTKLGQAAFVAGMIYLDAMNALNSEKAREAERKAEELRKKMEEVAKSAHDFRVEMAGGGNKLPGLAGTSPDAGVPDILKGTGIPVGMSPAAVREIQARWDGLAQAEKDRLQAQREQHMRYVKETTDFYQAAWKRAAENTQDVLSRVLTSQIKTFRGFLQNILQGIQQVLAQLASAKLIASAGDLAFDLLVPTIHSGGEVGRTASGSRKVSSMAFAGAPRFHSGGMVGPDEVPAILQKGEMVLSRDQVARGGKRSPVTVHISMPLNVNAIDARGVSDFLEGARPMIARQLVEMVRGNSQFAAAVRGA